MAAEAECGLDLHETGRARALPLRLLFTATIFLGAFLLFLTQPMVARMALPRLGGAPAVWNSALLLYQALLLAGYAYAHWLTRLSGRVQLAVHLGLFGLAALSLPVGIAGFTPSVGSDPGLFALRLLGASIGPLFFVITAQSPLMQAWFARSHDPRAADPYFLYAASNLGSFAGLIAYPLLFEPLLPLSRQAHLWTAGYIALAALVALCGLALPRRVPIVRTGGAPARPAAPLGWRRRLYWVVLAAVPSGLLLSSTTYLTTEIIAAPLLWVIPLGLYLLSYSIAFGRRGRLVRWLIAAAPLVVLIVGAPVLLRAAGFPLVLAGLNLILLFFAALGLHARLAADRPDVVHLTDFYLMLSLGGVVGGLFAALLAPMLFDWTWEHPLLILAAVALLPARPLFGDEEPLVGWPATALVVGALPLSLLADSAPVTGIPQAVGIMLSAVIALAALFAMGRGWRYPVLVALLMMSYGGWTGIARSLDPGVRERSYFGIYGIEQTPDGLARFLRHGTTMHGMQSLDPALATTPGTYYAPGSGVGLAFGAASRLYGPRARLGVVGLGTGTLSCYARPGQSWTFFEIDPLMVRIARDPERFSFLSRCLPGGRIVLGDARLTLARQPADSLDLLAIDAFSSDAVPVHMLTREAFALYDRVLARNGILLVHISNRHLDLEPVLDDIARRQRWGALVRDYRPDEAESEALATRSVWVAMARDPDVLARLVKPTWDDGRGWRPLRGRPGFRGWTDDYGSILSVLR